MTEQGAKDYPLISDWAWDKPDKSPGILGEEKLATCCRLSPGI